MKRTCLILSALCLLLSFCTKPVTHKNYETLLQSYPEIDILVKYYQSQKDTQKIKAIEYLLDRLPDQYYIQYYLSRPQPVDTIRINTALSADSIALQLQRGYQLHGDTIFDISYIKAQMLIDHIESSFSNWHKDIPFSLFCSTLLPYRVNNARADSFTALFKQRFSIKEMMREDSNIQGNLILISSRYFAGNRGPGDVIDFLAVSPFQDVLRGKEQIKDIEDENTGQVLLLRSLGVPMTSHYAPALARSTGGVYASLSMAPDSVYHDPSIRVNNYKRGVAKVYRLAFEKEKWNNPYDEVLKTGMPPANIPFSLFIPKMEDITAERAIAKDITLVVPDSVLDQKAVYICCYMKNKWEAMYWGAVNPEKKNATFNRMGTGVLYQLATHKKGVTRTFGAPFIVDSTGHITAIGQQKVSCPDLSIKQSNSEKNISPSKRYLLYGWNIHRQAWQMIQEKTSDPEGILIFSSVCTNGLYKILSPNEDSNVRIFTIADQQQQWW